MLKIKNISKSYSDKPVLSDISFTANKGVNVILGANGAGKTSLLSIICDVVPPSCGEVLFKGENIRQMGERYLKTVAQVHSRENFFGVSTVIDYMRYSGRLKSIPPKELDAACVDALRLLGALPYKRVRLPKLSDDMRLRVFIAQTVMTRPEVIIFDEPEFNSPQGKELKAVIRDLAANAAVLVSSHNPEDIKDIADKLIILDKGKLLYEGAIDGFSDNITDFYLEKIGAKR